MSKRTELKAALYDRLIDVVQNGIEVLTEDGELVRATAPAPYLQAAIALLKVEEDPAGAQPANLGDALQKLQKARPGQLAAVK